MAYTHLRRKRKTYGFRKTYKRAKKKDSWYSEQLERGAEIEHEHHKTLKAFKKGKLTLKQAEKAIAKDHLKENKQYYQFTSKGGKEYMVSMKKGRE